MFYIKLNWKWESKGRIKEKRKLGIWKLFFRGERMEEMLKKIGDDDDLFVFDKNIGYKRILICKLVIKII